MRAVRQPKGGRVIWLYYAELCYVAAELRATRGLRWWLKK